MKTDDARKVLERAKAWIEPDGFDKAFTPPPGALIESLATHLRAALEERDRLMRFAGGIIGDDFFEYRDVDALWVEEIAAEVGIVVKTTATAEDAKTEWAQEWGIEEGDDCTKMTDFGAKCVHFAIDAARAKQGGE